MTPSGDLHELIHSLTKTEKRYYKLFVTRTAGAKNTFALKVFDAIAKQKTYDEEKLLAQFTGESFTTNFAAYKNIIYNTVLRALLQYHESTQQQEALHAQVRHVKLLIDKNLFKQAYKLNQRIRKKALANNDYAVILETIEFDRKILFIRSGEYLYDAEPHVVVERLNEIETETLRLWQKTSTMRAIETTILERHYNFPKHFSTWEQAQAWAESLMQHPYFLPDATLENFYIFQLYHYTHVVYESQFRTNYAQAMDYAVTLVNAFEAEPERIRLSGYMYPQACSMVVVNAIWMYDDATANVYVDKMYNAQKTYGLESSPELDRYTLQAVVYEGVLLTSSLNINRVLNYVDRAQLLLEKYSSMKRYELERQIVLASAEALFSIGNYKQCIEWCNRFIHTPQYFQYTTSVVVIRVLLILSHYEIGNKELIDSLARSALRSLDSFEIERPDDAIFFRAIRKIAISNSTQEEQQRIQTMLNDMVAANAALPNAIASRINLSLHFVWGQAHIKGVSFREEYLFQQQEYVRLSKGD